MGASSEMTFGGIGYKKTRRRISGHVSPDRLRAVRSALVGRGLGPTRRDALVNELDHLASARVHPELEDVRPVVVPDEIVDHPPA